MKGLIEEFMQIVNAEDFFEFFDIPFDPHVLNVNRLHILKKFSIYIHELDSSIADVTDERRLDFYQEALLRAYNDLIASSPKKEKLFRVFHEEQCYSCSFKNNNSESTCTLSSC